MLSKRFEGLQLGAHSPDGGSEPSEETKRRYAKTREFAIALQTVALDAARREVLAARREPGMDPEVADHVLRKLDLQTMIVPEHG
ncbi:hypothetical protein [Sinomonas sp. ASV322]|uniref:hypothetical protein n=1 Tax=Sinomonas sp. ASV322 TaxID=3041920 RepID=UPI0027DD4D6A|nr:hypothetical protein [Sinomonas sp. ASV322]MDQ4501111.1 hypothetical protein [Sinomonas sp. ASV322]